LRTHVKATHANVPSAGHARRIAAVEVHVYDQTRAIVLPPLVARFLIGFIFSNHFSFLAGQQLAMSGIQQERAGNR
jgi:hypothetical protein